MNSISKGGLALARQIVPAYFDNPKVRVVLVGGSVARGCADDYSDLEIGVFWSAPPSEDERKVAIECVGGELWTFDCDGHTMEHYGISELAIGVQRYTGTTMISSQHLTVTAMEACLLDVIDHYDTSLDKQSLIAAIQHAVPLFGAELLQQWQAKAAIYPDKLAIKMVQENLWFGPWFCPEAYSGRDDILVLYQHFIWVEQSMLKVLAGLNRIYYPSSEHKWMDRLIGQMHIAPLNLSSRLKQVFCLDPLEGWHQLKELVYETISLVESHMPEVDTVSLFETHPEVNLPWAKKRWETYPPYTLMRNIGACAPPAPDSAAYSNGQYN